MEIKPISIYMTNIEKIINAAIDKPLIVNNELNELIETYNQDIVNEPDISKFLNLMNDNLQLTYTPPNDFPDDQVLDLGGAFNVFYCHMKFKKSILRYLAIVDILAMNDESLLRDVKGIDLIPHELVSLITNIFKLDGIDSNGFVDYLVLPVRVGVCIMKPELLDEWDNFKLLTIIKGMILDTNNSIVH